MKQTHLVLVTGPSNSGKDYVASKYFPYYYNLKLNQPFKDQFEVDHHLAPGTCNKKSLRNQTLVCGPCRGLTISEAMVLAYKNSQLSWPSDDLGKASPNWKYGMQFLNFTIEAMPTEIKKFVESSDRSLYHGLVVSDLRKPLEGLRLGELAKQYNFKASVIRVENKFAKPLDSDLQQNKAIRNFIHAFNQTVLDQTIFNHFPIGG